MKKNYLLVVIFLLTAASLFAQRDSLFYFYGRLQPDGSLKTDSGFVVKRDNTKYTGFSITYPKGGSKVNESVDFILANSDAQISETEQLLSQVKIPELREQLRYLLEREKIDKESYEKLKSLFDKPEKWDEETSGKNEPEPCKKAEIDFKEIRDYVKMVLREKQYTATEPPVLDYNCLSMHPERLQSYNFEHDEYIKNFFASENEMLRKLMAAMRFTSIYECRTSAEELNKVINDLCTIYYKKVEYFKKTYVDSQNGPMKALNNILYFQLAVITAKSGTDLGCNDVIASFYENAVDNFYKIQGDEIQKYSKKLESGDLQAFTYLPLYKDFKYNYLLISENRTGEEATDITYISKSLFKLSMSFEGKLKEVENSDYLNQSASAKAKDLYYLCVPDSAEGLKFLPVDIQEKQFHVFDVTPRERMAIENQLGQMTGKDGSMTYQSPENYTVSIPEVSITNICSNPDSCIIKFSNIGPSAQNFTETWNTSSGQSINLPEGLNNIFKNLFMYTELMKSANELKENPNSISIDKEKLEADAKKMAEEMKEKMKDPNFNYQDYLKKMQDLVKNATKQATDIVNSVAGFTFRIPITNGNKELVNIMLQAAVINPDFAKYIESGTANIKMKKINPTVKENNLFDLLNEK